MEKVEVGRIVVGSVWKRRRTGAAVRVNNFVRDDTTMQDRVVFVDESGNAGTETLHGFFLRFTPYLDKEEIEVIKEGSGQKAHVLPAGRVAGAHHAGEGH